MLRKSFKIIISLLFVLSTVTVLNGITPISFAAGDVPYTDEELCIMAKAYCNNVNGFVPPIVEVDGTDGDDVIIHLYSIVNDHTATTDWYTVNRYTAKGKNVLE